MKKIKRVLSMLLCLVMLLSLFPTAVFAETEETTIPEEAEMEAITETADEPETQDEPKIPIEPIEDAAPSVLETSDELETTGEPEENAATDTMKSIDEMEVSEEEVSKETAIESRRVVVVARGTSSNNLDNVAGDLQPNSTHCTTSATVTMLRRKQVLCGKSATFSYNDVRMCSNPTLTKADIDSGNVGNQFLYSPSSGYYTKYTESDSMYYYTSGVTMSKVGSSTSERLNTIKSLLSAHPEGIVIYVNHGSSNHAIVISKYDSASNQYYGYDPNKCADESGKYVRNPNQVPIERTWLCKQFFNGNVEQMIDNLAAVAANVCIWYISSTSCPHVPGTEYYHTEKNKDGKYVAICNLCGEEYPYKSTFTNESAGLYHVTSEYNLNSEPYPQAQTGIIYSAGQEFIAVGQVKNAYKDTWYETDDGYYIYSVWAERVGDASYLTISGVKKPEGDLPLNKSFGLEGIISSSSNLSEVSVRVVNTSTGQVVPNFDYSKNPNSKTYNIKTGGADSALKFANLPKGNYRYIVSATNATTCTLLVKSDFTVGGGSSDPIIAYVQTYTVSYDANGGTGVPTSQTKYEERDLQLSSTIPTREGYTFQGWSTSRTGSVEYQPGGYYTTDADITLYAVWSSTSAYITISGETKPTGDLPLNKGFSLQGIISSSPNLTNVTAQIINTITGAVVDGFNYSVNPNSATYNIQSGGADKALKFGSLPVGNYRYVVKASNSVLGTKTLIDSAFTMGGGIASPVAPDTPSVSVDGQSVTVSWNNVANETSYDVYLVQAPWGWEDIKYSATVGTDVTTYTFTDIAYGDYSAFVISRPNDNSMQSGWAGFSVAVPYSVFDLNGNLDGITLGGIGGYGTADIYIKAKPHNLQSKNRTLCIAAKCR